MYCPVNIGIKSFDFGQNRFSAGGPVERPLVLVILLDIFFDLAHQVRDAFERAATNRLLRDECEPAFYLVEPRGIESARSADGSGAGQPTRRVSWDVCGCRSCPR